MTESYVPGFWLWRMVILLPLLVILVTYAVGTSENRMQNYFLNQQKVILLCKGYKRCCGSCYCNNGEF